MRVYWTTPKPTLSFIPFLKRHVARKALRVATEVWDLTVDLTPVQSGELRASWNLSQGKPNYTTVGLPGSSSNFASPLPRPSKPNLPEVDLNDAVYFVTNGKSYASYVEYGSKTNAPRLMLSRAIQIVGR
jgi:hypothetical protein